MSARPGFPRELAGAPLTPRELEIIQLAANGMSNAEIAAHCYISAETVRSHVKRLMVKLQAHSRAHAAAEALRRGLIL